MKQLIFGFFLLMTQSDVWAKKPPRQTISQTLKKQYLEVFKANEKLHGAFFKYDEDKITNALKEVQTKLKAVQDKEMQKLLSQADKALTKVKKGAKQADNNKNYHLFSSALSKVIKKYDLGSTYNMYYCSMLKMKWVQNSEKMPRVHNPYADYMPHCGVQATRY